MKWIPWKYGDPVPSGEVFLKWNDGFISSGTRDDWNWGSGGSTIAYAFPDDEEPEQSAVSALDSQVGGDHYKKLGNYQPWIVLHKWLTPEEFKGAIKKDVIGYLAREADKGGIEDMRKAMHTLQIFFELTNGETK